MIKPNFSSLLSPQTLWAVDASYLEAAVLQGFHWSEEEMITEIDKPEHGIVQVSGLLHRGEGYRWRRGDSLAIAEKIREAAETYGAVLLELNTPGGQTDGLHSVREAIEYAKTIGPVYGYIFEGKCASGGYHIAAACDKLYASKKGDLVGSLGVYATLQDVTEALEKRGIKLHNIYADGSEEKHLPVKEALKGNYEPFKSQVLNPERDDFIADITSQRQITAPLALKGKLYRAEDAQKNGLIDGILSYEQVIEKLMNHKSTSTGAGTPPMTEKAKASAWDKAAAMFGFSSSASQEEEQPPVVEEAPTTSATLEGLSEKIIGLTESVAQLTLEKGQLMQEKQASDAKVTDLETKLAAANAEIKRLGALDGDTLTQVETDGVEDVETSAEALAQKNERDQKRDGFAQNQYARKILSGGSY
ncbi:MAG: S49 family peptidase [Bacteroidota bacterium]